MKLKCSILAGIVMGLLVLLGFWLGGFDFNERGEKAVICMMMVMTLGSLVFCAFMASDIKG